MIEGTVIYLSLGSNLGDRRLNLEHARGLIGEQLGTPGRVSGVFESTAWGYSSDNTFYNCCLSATTIMEPLSLLNSILAMEKSLGRIRKEGGYADRVIDIDLLLYGDQIVDHLRLKIPHPAMAERRFVLAPLAEIAPHLVHPVTGITIAEMLIRCPDQAAVNPLRPG